MKIYEYIPPFILLMFITTVLSALSFIRYMDSEKPEKPVRDTPIYDVPNFTLIDDEASLNSWRQENFDKHIVFFSKKDCWLVEKMLLIKNKYPNQDIVDIAILDEGYIILLQEKFEPYTPSIK